MSDTALKMQSVAMLAQELHVSLDIAEIVLDGIVTNSKAVSKSKCMHRSDNGVCYLDENKCDYSSGNEVNCCSYSMD